MNIMRKFAVAAAFFAPLFAGCSHTPSVQKAVEPYTYKIDIQQGNVVTQEMVAKLRQGMTPAQVRYVLGSPLVTDAFHPDRWDYVYVYEKGHKVAEQHRLTVIFADDKLSHLEGDVQLQDTLAGPEKASDVPAPAVSAVPAAVPAAPAAAPASTNSAPAQLAPAPVSMDAANPDTVQSDAAKPAAAVPVGDSAKTDKPATEADAAKSGDESKPKQRGFFGRMLDKIGL